MKKIGIVILHPWYLPSWFESGVLEELTLSQEISIISTREIIEICKKNYSKFPVINYVEITVTDTHFITKAYSLAAVIVRMKQNSSFQFRVKNLIFSEINLIPKPFTIKLFYFSIKTNLRYFVKYFFRYSYQIPLFVPGLNKIIHKFLKYFFNRSTFGLPNEFKVKFDFLIFTSGAEDSKIFELIKTMKSAKTKSILCIENWDNLTSKRYMIYQADKILVLGQSSVELARNIQGIQKEKVIAAGLPRFNPYRSIQKVYSSTSAPKFIILYLGCYTPHNEKRIINNLVNRLDATILKNQYKIFYKPHPGARERFFDDSWLDENVEIYYSSERKNPTINRAHISVIQNANMIICTPTSMVIECMMLGKKVILDVSDDGIHRTTAGKLFEKHLHLRVLESISLLKKCFRIDQVVECILDEYKNPTLDFINYDLDKLIENKAKSYAIHLLDIID
jgi:hypothetical protein